MVNETKPDTENASNWNHFGFGVNNKSKCDERVLFRVSLQNLDLYLNPQTMDNLNLRFSTTDQFCQILEHFL